MMFLLGCEHVSYRCKLFLELYAVRVSLTIRGWPEIMKVLTIGDDSFAVWEASYVEKSLSRVFVSG
jgi:hypothetical protein